VRQLLINAIEHHLAIVCTQLSQILRHALRVLDFKERHANKPNRNYYNRESIDRRTH
jgi:hypothetical protein